jgi:hypothetical protein
MTPSTAIEGSKTFSLALSLKSLAKQTVRAVQLIGTPHTKLLRFNFSLSQKSLAKQSVRMDRTGFDPKLKTPRTKLLRFIC